jgi:hypothetical protein
MNKISVGGIFGCSTCTVYLVVYATAYPPCSCFSLASSLSFCGFSLSCDSRRDPPGDDQTTSHEPLFDTRAIHHAGDVIRIAVLPDDPAVASAQRLPRHHVAFAVSRFSRISLMHSSHSLLRSIHHGYGGAKERTTTQATEKQPSLYSCTSQSPLPSFNY